MGFLDCHALCASVHKKYACKLDKTCIIDFDEHNIPVKISLIFVAIWIGLCAGMSCLWEDWGYFEAFYFFFISLSTIGLGELMPTQPQYLLLMFVKIMIGLTLFSICITSIQHALENLLSHCLSKLRATEEEEEIDEFDVESNHKQHISLGVFRSYGSNFSLNKLHSELNNNINKGSQTILNNKINIKSFIRRTPSFEDVVKVINEIEDHEIEDAKLQEEIDRNNNNKENSADSFELLYNKKTCRCCLALANGSIVTSILLHRYNLRNNLMQCPSYLSSLTSLNTRKFVKLKHNEKLKIKQIEDHTLLMP
uniref:Potassium channel domain-containing protein n=1 Tax=Acrobeloides nanus TaxID=290746 RepID=A0A914DM75_9BILA